MPSTVVQASLCVNDLLDIFLCLVWLLNDTGYDRGAARAYVQLVLV